MADFKTTFQKMKALKFVVLNVHVFLVYPTDDNKPMYIDRNQNGNKKKRKITPFLILRVKC